MRPDQLPESARQLASQDGGVAAAGVVKTPEQQFQRLRRENAVLREEWRSQESPWMQPIGATLTASASAEVMTPYVLRERVFERRAIAWRCRGAKVDRSVPLGESRRKSPLEFSLVPRGQGSADRRSGRWRRSPSSNADAAPVRGLGPTRATPSVPPGTPRGQLAAGGRVRADRPRMGRLRPVRHARGVRGTMVATGRIRPGVAAAGRSRAV